VFTWQDPIPEVDHSLIDQKDSDKLKAAILKSGLTVPELVKTAWASASTFRDSDMRGGENGARIRLAPQSEWAANDPEDLARVLAKLSEIQQNFNASAARNKQVSLADVIVLGGAAAIEQAAKAAGYRVPVPFTPGRADATPEMTDAESFGVLEPHADAFRNYYTDKAYAAPAVMLVEKADLLTLTVPEMTALLGGMRALNANAGGSQHGVLTDKPGTLSNDFFRNLLDMSTAWSKSETEGIYEGRDRASNDLKWTASTVDLIFGSNSELRAVAQAYASADAGELFVRDFVAAWNKVMMLDRFDVN
jgi:catalase-peroxidase